MVYTYNSWHFGLSTFQVFNRPKCLNSTILDSTCLYSLNRHTNSCLIWLLKWLFIHHFYSHTLCSTHIKLQALRALGFVLVVPCLKYNSSTSSEYCNFSSPENESEAKANEPILGEMWGPRRVKWRKKGRTKWRCEMESLFRKMLSHVGQTSEKLIPPGTVHGVGEEEGFIHNLSFFIGQILAYVLLNPPHFRLPICSPHWVPSDHREASV